MLLHSFPPLRLSAVSLAGGGGGSRAGLLMPSRFTDEDTEAGEG